MEILANYKAKSTDGKTVALDLVSLDWQYYFVYCMDSLWMNFRKEWEDGSGFAVSSL